MKKKYWFLGLGLIGSLAIATPFIVSCSDNTQQSEQDNTIPPQDDGQQNPPAIPPQDGGQQNPPEVSPDVPHEEVPTPPNNEQNIKDFLAQLKTKYDETAKFLSTDKSIVDLQNNSSEIVSLINSSNNINLEEIFKSLNNNLELQFSDLVFSIKEGKIIITCKEQTIELSTVYENLASITVSQVNINVLGEKNNANITITIKGENLSKNINVYGVYSKSNFNSKDYNTFYFKNGKYYVDESSTPNQVIIKNKLNKYDSGYTGQLIIGNYVYSEDGFGTPGWEVSKDINLLAEPQMISNIIQPK